MARKRRAITPEEEAAIDKIARALEPDAWVEYDAGNGVCTNTAGWTCVASIKAAQRLIRAYPAMVPVVQA